MVAEEVMRKSSLAVAILLLAGTLVGVAILPQNARAATLYVGGGGPGNYTTIQAAIDAAFPGDTVYVYNGTYNETVSIAKTLSLIGEDTSTTIIDTLGGEDAIHISSSWVNVTGFTLMSSGIRNGAGIELNMVRDCYIANNSVGPNFIDGILLFFTSGNRIVNNTISGNGYGIDFYMSTKERILNNTIVNHEYGIYHMGSSYSTIKGNTMVGNSIYLLSLDLSKLNTHTIDTSNTVNGKPVYYWKNLSGGNVPLGAGEVIIVNCTDVTVQNQNVSGGTVGIYVTLSANITLSNITASYGMHGIEMFLTQNSTLSLSNASHNTYDGIGLQHSPGNTLRNNTAFNNAPGIMFGMSGSGTITGNTASRNTDGFFVFSSDDSTIKLNNVSANTVGIRVLSSYGNRIYHNLLLGNNEQASDNTDGNEWDNGYPSGGNYWSDYAGVDLMWGPGQNLTGSDGIGDTPYVIDTDSQDRYPLMRPIVPPTRAPVALDARLSGNGFENVTMEWILSPDDGGGYYSVIEYGIYRGTTYDIDGVGYGLVVSLANGTSTFTDALAGEGDPNSYFYMVCAVDRNNITSCANEQMGKFTRPLAKGPNLVSVPLAQSNVSIETVLQTVEFDKAWAYDSGGADRWQWFMPFKTYEGDLRSAERTKGVWVNATEECNLTAAGMVPLQTMIELHKGWNLVGLPTFRSPYTLAWLLAETGGTKVEGYDPSVPPFFLRVLTTLVEPLPVGYGYWVHVESAIAWVVQGS